MARKKIGEILIEMRIIIPETLHQALQLQKGTGKRLGEVLEDMDVVIEEDVAKALSKQFGIPHVKGLSRFRFPQEVLNLIDADLALTRYVFPLKVDGKVLYVAMSDPLNIDLQNDLSFKANLRVSPCVTTSEEIKSAVQKHYLKEVNPREGEQQLSILLVDDQVNALLAAEAALTKDGYTTYKARNGAEGLAMAIQVRPHLIITDIAMPRMDGVEMFRSLQANRSASGIPVIALSAKATPEEEYRLLEMGFYDFIPKPINPVRLVARARRALRQTQGARQ